MFAMRRDALPRSLRFVVVDRVGTQAPPPQPSPVTPDGMRHGPEPVVVGRGKPVDRETHHTLGLLAVPGLRIRPPWQAEDPVRFIVVAGYGSTPKDADTCPSLCGQQVRLTVWFLGGTGRSCP